jgi:hypothetical protein
MDSRVALNVHKIVNKRRPPTSPLPLLSPSPLPLEGLALFYLHSLAPFRRLPIVSFSAVPKYDPFANGWPSFDEEGPPVETSSFCRTNVRRVSGLVG